MIEVALGVKRGSSKRELEVVRVGMDIVLDNDCIDPSTLEKEYSVLKSRFVGQPVNKRGPRPAPKRQRTMTRQISIGQL